MKKMLGLALGAVLLASPAVAEEPVKIGWVDTYTAMPNVMEKARHGAQMAADEANAAGGLHGRKVKLLFRDDKVTPSEGVKVAQELVERDHVTLLAGASFGGISKAIYEYAEHQHIPYFATWCSSDICTKREGTGYTFSYEEPYDQVAATLAEKAASYPIKKWAVVRYNDAWDLAVSDPFVEALKKLRPEAGIVQTVTLPSNALDMGAVVQSLKKHGAEGVYVTLYGQGLANYIRTSRARGSLEKIKHLHPYLPPEALASLGKEAPLGWYVTGYPEDALKAPAHQAFLKAYRDAYHTDPGFVGLLSYVSMKSALTAAAKAESLAPEAIVKAGEDLSIETPVGSMRLKASDHRADFNYWYGTVDVADGKPVMKDFTRGAETGK